MEVAEERSPAMSDSSEGEVFIIHHCNEDYLNHLDLLGDMISMILVKTMRMILNLMNKYLENTPMIAKEGDEDQEDLGGRNFLNILSVLAGRNSLGLARWR